MALQFAIYTCPPIPTGVASPDPSSKDTNLFSPLSCTLIFTPSAALLIDCPASVIATADLASWVKSTLPFGCTLKYFIASHAHGDHFFGFPVLQDAFPAVQALATSHVAEGAAQQYEPAVYNGDWKTLFPTSSTGTGMPEKRALFKALPLSNKLDLEGHVIEVHDILHGDTSANSFVHVPELGLVVAGDIVYNGDCHQHLREACTQEKRNHWRAGLSQIAAVQPNIIVPGHTFTPVCKSDKAVTASMLESTRDYITGFEEELAKAETADELFRNMRSRYDRWNLSILYGSCQGSISAKQSS